jgi:hypothetical protein
MSALPIDTTIMQSFEIFQQVDEMERYMRSQIMFVDDECTRSAKRRKELQGQVHEFLTDTRNQVMEQQRHVTALEIELEKERYKTHMLAEQFERDHNESTKISKHMLTMTTVLSAIQGKLAQCNNDAESAHHAQIAENEAKAKQMLESNSSISSQLQDLVESQQAMTKVIEETLPEQLNLTFKQIIQVISNESLKNSNATNNTSSEQSPLTAAASHTVSNQIAVPHFSSSSPLSSSSSSSSTTSNGALSPNVIPVLDASSSNTTLPAFATTEPYTVVVTPAGQSAATDTLVQATVDAPTAPSATNNTIMSSVTASIVKSL